MFKNLKGILFIKGEEISKIQLFFDPLISSFSIYFLVLSNSNLTTNFDALRLLLVTFISSFLVSNCSDVYKKRASEIGLAFGELGHRYNADFVRQQSGFTRFMDAVYNRHDFDAHNPLNWIGELSNGIGSGIVWDSNSWDEYRECQIKAEVLKAFSKQR